MHRLKQVIKKKHHRLHHPIIMADTLTWLRDIQTVLLSSSVNVFFALGWREYLLAKVHSELILVTKNGHIRLKLLTS